MFSLKLARFWKNSSRCVCFSSAFFPSIVPLFWPSDFSFFSPIFYPFFARVICQFLFRFRRWLKVSSIFLSQLSSTVCPRSSDQNLSDQIWLELIWSELIWSEPICSQNCQILALVLLPVLVLPSHQNFYQTAQVFTCYGFITMIAHLQTMWAEWKWGRWNIAFLRRSLILILNTAGDFVQVKICKIS